MNTETMTVHEALCELKTIDKRISRAVSECVPVSTKEHDAKNVNGMGLDQFSELASQKHQSAMDLIRRRSAIKAAISQYNASKIISVGGQEYTMAQAIWLMSYGMNASKMLLERYTVMLNDCMNRIERDNGRDLNERAERAASAAFDSKDKADPEKYLRCIADYKAAHMLELVDPMDVRRIISELDESIHAFESKIDSAIQVANATTEITINY